MANILANTQFQNPPLSQSTNDANASAGNILSGNTAYVKGSKLTGTMPNYAGVEKASTAITYDADNEVVKAAVPSSGYYNTSSKVTLTKAQIAALDGIGLIDPDSITTRYARGYVTSGKHATLPFTPTGVIGFITKNSSMTSSIYYIIVDNYAYETWQSGATNNGYYPYLDSKTKIDNTNRVYNNSKDGTVWYSAGIE